MTALKTFEVVARHKQLKTAAEELFVTPSAVSRQIKLLEDHLGVELFCRDKRVISLTEVGKTYATDLHRIFDDLYGATRRLTSQAENRTLNILTSMMSITQRWLMPRLFQYQQQDSALEIRLTTCTEISPIDFDRNTVDIGLTRQKIKREGLQCEPLIPELLVVVCSPALVKEKTINTVDDLLDHRLITTLSRADTWDKYLGRSRFSENFVGQIQLAHLFFALEAAIGGLGVAVLPLPLIADDLRQGKLIAPLKQAIPSGEIYYAVYSAAEQEKKDVSSFVTWLKEQAEHTSKEVCFEV